MKKMFKFAIVISIVLTLLSGNVAVLAAELADGTESEPTAQTQQSQTSVNTQDDNTADNVEGSSTETETNAGKTKSADDTSSQASAQSQSSKKTTSSVQEQEEPKQEVNSIMAPETKTSLTETQGSPAKLFVTLSLRLPNNTLKSQDFNVTLKKNTNGDATQTATEIPLASHSGSNGKLYYEFDNIPTDTDPKKLTDYDLTITGKNYQKYTQIVSVKSGKVTTIDISNSFDVNATKTETGTGTVKRAVMGVGAINGNDDAIDKKDIDEMISSMEENKNSYDLNGDGKTNIIDLSYIALNKGKNSAQAGDYGYDQLINVNEEILNAEQDDKTKIKGQLTDLFKNNDSHVSIGPKNEAEEISSSNPVELTINLGDSNKTETEEITIAPSTNPDNNIQSGEVIVTYTDKNGEDQTITAKVGATIQNVQEHGEIKELYKLAATTSSDFTKKIATEGQAKVESDGTIVIDLGSKVAVKKVTIRVTGTKSKKLADIAKVEFLNEMEDRIPAPVIQSPTNLKGEAAYDSLVIYWDSMENVTGYELEIKATVEGKEQIETHKTEGNQITLEQFCGKGFKDLHYTDFDVRVQSINGEWKSGYGGFITLTPKPNSVPAEPDNLFVKGGVREITATWKNMKSTRSYDVQYKKFDEPDSQWKTVAEKLETNNYTIKNLEDKVRYQVRVRGENELGKGPWCTPGEATTKVAEPAMLPRYGAINLPKKDSQGKEIEGAVTQHIVSSSYGRKEAFMVDSPLDTGKDKSALGIVDNSYASYWQVNDWDDGGFYNDANGNKGFTVELDQSYEMNYFTMAQVENLGTVGYAKIYYWDESGTKKGPIEPAQMITRKDANNRDYIVIKLAEPIKTNKLNIQIGRRGDNTNKITIAEMRFYHYNSLEDDVNKLFADQMHLKLADGVNKQTIDALQKRLDTPDEEGEYNPEKDSIQIELNLAYSILDDNKLQDEIVEIDTTVTSAKDGHITFRSGLNAWQPLGVVAHSNENIKVYVGNPNKKIGDSTNIRLIATQYHAEAAYWMSKEINLKVGINEITVPEIITSSRERGGSLYIEYTGNNPAEQYSVRVSGGEKIPVLDLSKYERTDKTGRKVAVEAYVTEIEERVPKLESYHNSKHAGSDIPELDYSYYNDKNEEDCILGATEIVLDQMMYSVSSRQILEGLNKSTAKGTNADKLYNSLVAMEDMIDLYYAHKGLTKEADENNKLNQYPSGRLNIRYHIMFAGAAMYAGGKHIGIPYGDVPTLAQGNPIVTDEDGKYQSGNYFGWGIGHEIGHIINESAYVHGEVTNNYFSVLAQAQDTNATVRFQYPEVYKKVTSGKTGKAQNVFTQLGLYWQFHLANDVGGYNFETYDSYEEQCKNLVFARMDRYAREYAANKTTSAPKPNGVELEIGNSKDDNLMRLACAATEKNVLTFFEKWGMVPDVDTVRYASQFEKIYEEGTKKEKAIWYINDDARAYQLAQGAKMPEGTKVTAEVTNGAVGNQKVLTLSTDADSNTILGYEINRVSWAYGEEIKTPIGFITTEELAKSGGKYTDTIEAINNRVFEYKIVAYDKYLNSTEECVTEQFKVEHGGNIARKADWEITTNFMTEAEKKLQNEKDSKENKNNVSQSKCSASENETKGTQDILSAKSLIDGKYDTDYVASAPSGENGQITITLPEETNLVGLRYKTVDNKELTNYSIEVSQDGSNWETVTKEKVGLISRVMNISLDNGSHTTYFNPEGTDKLCVYTARYVRIITTDKNISIAEIDLLGQTGDNIDFTKDADGNYQGIGILKEPVPLGKNSKGEDETIPANSIVFTGTYKGNPAYNTPVLYDDEGNPIEIYGAIFADPITDEKDKLGKVSKGIWVYWVEPKDSNYEKVKNDIKAVRAELYRTDNAMTFEGERLTSDTYLVDIPRDESGNLPTVVITKDNK